MGRDQYRLRRARLIAVSIGLRIEHRSTRVTYRASRKHIPGHKSLAFRHGLQEVWNTEDQIVCGCILTELSIDVCLHS